MKNSLVVIAILFLQGFVNDEALQGSDLQTAAIDPRLKESRGSNGWVIGRVSYAIATGLSTRA